MNEIRKLLTFNYLPLISKYRTELMGLGIINVLLYHWIAFSNLSKDNIFIIVLSEFNKFVFTEGFLFLSGFGLYYSFTKNSDTITFWKKRALRVYLPYLIMTLPFLTYFDLFENSSIFDFLLDITCLFFWKEGNKYGMWYIAISIILYLIFPLVYKICILKDNRKTIERLLLLMLISLCIPVLIKLVDSNYYKIIKIGIDRVFIFLCGLAYGYVSHACRVSKNKLLIYNVAIINLFVITYVVSLFADPIYNFLQMVSKLVTIPTICCIFNIMGNNKFMQLLNREGHYTLELYILHLFFYSLFSSLFVNVSQIEIMSMSILLALIICKPVHITINKVLL